MTDMADCLGTGQWDRYLFDDAVRIGENAFVKDYILVSAISKLMVDGINLKEALARAEKEVPPHVRRGAAGHNL